MINLIKPLVWLKTKNSNELAQTLTYVYEVMPDYNGFKTGYLNLKSSDPIKYATGFKTEDEAKQWAYKHHCEKMSEWLNTDLWVSANERLPNNENFYLVYMFDGHRDEFTAGIKWWDKEKGCFLSWSPTDEITHWIPLPEPPKELN